MGKPASVQVGKSASGRLYAPAANAAAEDPPAAAAEPAASFSAAAAADTRQAMAQSPLPPMPAAPTPPPSLQATSMSYASTGDPPSTSGAVHANSAECVSGFRGAPAIVAAG